MEYVLAIIAALAVPLGILLKWWIQRKTSAGAELQRQREENRQAIAGGDVNDLLNERLNRVPPRPKGPGPEH